MTDSGNNPRSVKLTPDFWLGEFIMEADPMPAPWVLDNLYRLAHRLQVVRDLLNRPVTVHSGYRTLLHNREVGGYPNSYHLSGMAADIVVEGMAASDVQLFLKNWQGGLGSYPEFTHLDIRPYRARWRR